MFSTSSLLATLSVLATANAQSLSDALGNNPDLSIFAGLAQKLDIASSLTGSDYTILAPVNAAFANISNPASATATTMVNGVPLSDLFMYHVIDGMTLMSADIGKAPYGNITKTLLTASSYDGLTNSAQVVNPVKNGTVVIYSGAKNASKVITADTTFDSGVIHSISNILAVPGNFSAIAKANSSLSLSTFAGGLKRANITSMTDGGHNLTIFATTSSGFSSANLNPSQADPTRLKDIFTFHVVSNGSVLYASDLLAFANNTNLTTMEGGKINIHFNGSHILVNNATISTANVLMKNGVVHIMNQLLDPQNPKGWKGGFLPLHFNAASSLVIPTSCIGLTLLAAAFFL